MLGKKGRGILWYSREGDLLFAMWVFNLDISCVDYVIVSVKDGLL